MGRAASAILRAVAQFHVSRWSAVVAVFLLAAGYLFAAQLRSRQPLRQATDLPSWRLRELAVMVRQQEAARLVLQAEVQSLMRRKAEYESALVEGRGLSQAMADELGQYRLALGLVPVEGTGVAVTVSEGPPGQSGVLPPRLEAPDLSGLTNELWSAGAEAMAINGLRTLASTAVRQTDAGIVLAGVRINPPYRIEAVGDPAALEAALAIRGGFVEGLRAVGLRVAVHRADVLRLPARSAPDYYRYARPSAR